MLISCLLSVISNNFWITIFAAIAESEVDDVRDVLDYYRQFEDPLGAYTKLQQEALVRDQQRLDELKQDSKQISQWSPSFLKKW